MRPLFLETVADGITELLPDELKEAVQPGILEQFFKDLPSHALSFGVKIGLTILVFAIGVKLIGFIRRLIRKSLDKAKVDTGTSQFLDSCLKVGLYIVLIFLIASGFGMNIATVVALLGSAGVTIGLAVQGSLANFAGGVLILLVKPFVVGDYIEAEGVEGRVFKIEIFYTRLLTRENKVVIIPNGSLSNSKVVNMTAMEKRKLVLTVGISYGSDLRKAKEVLLEMLKTCEYVLQGEDMLIAVEELADSSVNLRMQFWCDTAKVWEAKWEALEKAKLALDAGGIEIPFPQLDVHMDKAE